MHIMIVNVCQAVTSKQNPLEDWHNLLHNNNYCFLKFKDFTYNVPAPPP